MVEAGREEKLKKIEKNIVEICKKEFMAVYLQSL